MRVGGLLEKAAKTARNEEPSIAQHARHFSFPFFKNLVENFYLCRKMYVKV
jgi:hypothetical protein